ncbi:CREB-regulated transcription coactivator [Haematobia irritans]|uniref:CREB-regulated transcription coactivator n=1 Tax=Haematobia irritans TaxID=7368 RepID=UPI003F4F8281
MANPRKFSEKIALQRLKQAEGTAEFEKIMNEVKATRVDTNTLNNADASDSVSIHGNASLTGGSGGSGSSSGASGGGASPDANTISGGPIAVSSGPYRESRGRSMGGGPMRRPSERKQDRSPYGSTAGGLVLSGMPNSTQNTYLSPPMDTSWRRSNSDSALHQTLNMTEGNFGTSPQNSDLNSLHANYHHQHSQTSHQQQHHSQRSHSPNIGRSYSPQAQRRKNTMLQQQQMQQQQLHIQRLQMQQQQQAQQHHQLQSQQLQNSQHHMQQQTLCNANKFNNSNIPGNVMGSFANTGSLPDLTSVHFAPVSNNLPQMMQQPQQHNTLSPLLSPNPNNGCHERDQSPSPFSPPSGGGGGCGPPSPYHQQENSPTSVANISTANNQQTSPHLSFTNLSVQSPVNVSQQNAAQNPNTSFSTLPTLGAGSSAGNLTEYRQPLNPPSPGSSPGLLISGPSNDLHTSAPGSPIRHCQSNSGGGQNQSITIQQTSFGAIDSNQVYNNLHSTFHNDFEQFHLGDSCQSPQNNYDALDFDKYVTTGTAIGQGPQQHHVFNNKLYDMGDLSSSSANSTRTQSTSTTTNCSNNNNNLGTSIDNNTSRDGRQQQHHSNSQHFQHMNNNSSANTSTTNGPTSCRTGLMNNNGGQDLVSANTSPIPSPLSHCTPTPSSPLPIPMPSHSPAHNQQLSLSVQTSPHNSPMHSPHHAPSPLSVSSPGLSILGGSISPVPSSSAQILNNHHHNHMNNQNHQHLQHNHVNSQQQQNQTHTTPTTATNIPQIIFSDYSSAAGDIFDNLDLDLGQIDEPGMQMLSDQNPIMISDPSIEDSFRRDLN